MVKECVHLLAVKLHSSLRHFKMLNRALVAKCSESLIEHFSSVLPYVDCLSAYATGRNHMVTFSEELLLCVQILTTCQMCS
jgi:hypothetical protein